MTLATASDGAAQDIVAAAIGALDQTSDELSRRFEVLANELTPAELTGPAEALARFDDATQVFIAVSITGDADAVADASSERKAAHNGLATNSSPSATPMSSRSSLPARASGELPMRSGS